MLLDFWFLLGFLGVFASSVGGSCLVAFVYLAVVRRRVTMLEFAVADLEERLLKEIKTRAANLGVKARKADDELLESLAKTSTQPKANEPWWLTHVHPDLKGP